VAVVVPNASEQLIAEMIVNKTAAQNLTLRLFTNKYTPTELTTEANLVEASGFGYSSFALTAASWSIVLGNPSTFTYPLHTFSFSGALGNVYGWYLTQTTSGKLLCVERFVDGPYQVASGLDTIDVTPSFTLD
jgi:hypothetical protein